MTIHTEDGRLKCPRCDRVMEMVQDSRELCPNAEEDCPMKQWARNEDDLFGAYEKTLNGEYDG